MYVPNGIGACEGTTPPTCMRISTLVVKVLPSPLFSHSSSYCCNALPKGDCHCTFLGEISIPSIAMLKRESGMSL